MRQYGILTVLGVATAVGVATVWSAPAGYAAPTTAAVAPVAGLTAAQYRDSFAQRNGSHLTVAGHDFRFSGANVEWLGLEDYGPTPSTIVPVGSQHYATKYEVDDVLATARDMGATVIRAQTLGDTLGCAQCLEPQLGQFNPAAFAEMDMVVAEGRKYGIKLVGEFDGDGSGAPSPDGGESHDWYCTWRQVSNCEQEFFTNPALIADYENHMRTVLDHVNPYTGLAYKDDPTFAGWVDGNVLGVLNTPSPTLEGWIRAVSDDFHAIDHHQLFFDISAIDGISAPGTIDPGALRIPGVDVYATEYYPIVCNYEGDPANCDPKLIHQEAAQTAAARKTFAVMEFGWDLTNFPTSTALQQYLTGVEADPNIVGDNFWELLAHANGHGWQPIPADASHCPPSSKCGDNGNWWALYYTGIQTTSNTIADMAARAQLLRTHAYRMTGYATAPAHRPVPAPTTTSTTDGTVLFQGAAGSPSYTIQKRDSGGTWTTVCDDCVTDASPGWHDLNAAEAGCYRVIGHNLDGLEGPASPPAGNCSRPTRARRQ
ncbi:MAG TPA: hypothetical protein VGM75_09285 [Pseudonocardiaceae bacterium]